MTALVSTTSKARKGQPQAGDLVTVLVYQNGNLVESGARFKRQAYGTAFVKLVGLGVPAPYRVGDNLAIEANQVIDW